MTIKLLMCVLLVLLCAPVASAIEISDFLANDTTDENEYTDYYTCGHFTRDLARNAHSINMTMGAAILSDSPAMKGYNNHIVNYVKINGTVVFIEPQTDEMFMLEDVPFRFIKLYWDGTQVPTWWKYGLSHARVENGTIYEPYTPFKDPFEMWTV